MIIDCASCTASRDACSDCVVGVLLEESSCFEADGAEHRALVSLAQVGLVPELRHISAAAAG